MSEKSSLRKLYELMRVLEGQHALDGALEALEREGERDSVLRSVMLLDAYCRRQSIVTGDEASGQEDAGSLFEKRIGTLYTLIFEGIEQQTGRWNEDVWDIEAIEKNGKKSLENCFRESNTSYKRSTWYGKTKGIKPGTKGESLRIPDEDMIMQCCIGLHRTRNEAAQLMMQAGYHPLTGATRGQTALREKMYAVLERPQYGARQWNTMLFAKEEEKDVVNYTQSICTLITDALMRGDWVKNEREAEEFDALQMAYSSEDVLYDLLLTKMEARLKGTQGAQSLSKAQLQELLLSLDMGKAFDEVSQTDKKLYPEIRAAAQNPVKVDMLEKRQIRLSQVLYLSAGLALRREIAVDMVLKLGYFKGQDRETLLSGMGKNPADEAFARALLERLMREIGHEEMHEVSEAKQKEVFSKLYRRLMAYRCWTDEKTQTAIEKRMAQSHQAYTRELIGLLCSTRFSPAYEKAIAKGRLIPDDGDMACLRDVLSEEEYREAGDCLTEIRGQYERGVRALLEACAALGLTRGEALALLRDALVRPTGSMERLAAKEKQLLPADEAFCRDMMDEFAEYIEACMPDEEPDDEAVTALFNRLIAPAKKKGMAPALARLVSCYFSRVEHRDEKAEKAEKAGRKTEKKEKESSAEKLCSELASHGVIPQGRTLRGLVELMSMEEKTEGFWQETQEQTMEQTMEEAR